MMPGARPSPDVAAPMRGRRTAGAVLLGWLALALAAPLAAQPVRIDTFNVNQSTLSAPPGGSAIATSASDIIGTRRGIEVRNIAGAGPTTVSVAGGSLLLAVPNTTPDSRGEARLSWDGDANPLVLSPSGLGGVALTAGNASGLRIRCTAPTARAELDVVVYSGAGNFSRAARVLLPSAAVQDILLPYAEFRVAGGTGANFASVGAITLVARIGEGSLSCDEIVASAPAISATKVATQVVDLDGDGRVDPGDRVRYTVTIGNTGNEARNLDLIDTVDANTTLRAGSVRATPVARNDQYAVFRDLQLAADGTVHATLVGNDVDPDGGAVEVQASSFPSTSIQGGTLALAGAATGAFTYQPAAGFVGVDAFDYRIVDAQSNVASARATIVVSAIDVRVTVTPSADTRLVDNAGVFTIAAEVSRDGAAWIAAPAGTVLDFTYVGTGAVQAVTDPGPNAATCSLRAGGTCSVSATSVVTGSGTLRVVAASSLVADGVQVVPAGASIPVLDADPSPVDSRGAVITWGRYLANVQTSGTQPVGAPYAFTIVAAVDLGAGPQVATGAVAQFTWNGQPPIGADALSPGRYGCTLPCTVTVFSAVPFVGVIALTQVSSTFNGGTVVLTATATPQLVPVPGGALAQTITWQ